jgi:hypothetical protein
VRRPLHRQARCRSSFPRFSAVAGVSSSPGLGGLGKPFASWRSLSASLSCVALPKCKLRRVLQQTLVRGSGNQNYCERVTYDVEGLELSYVSSSSPYQLFFGFSRRLVGTLARGGRHYSHQLDRSLHSSGSLVSLQERNSEDIPLQEYRVSERM